jgi:hypothetical protein
MPLTRKSISRQERDDMAYRRRDPLSAKWCLGISIINLNIAGSSRRYARLEGSARSKVEAWWRIERARAYRQQAQRKGRRLP